jgi:hypothetical protein
MAATQQLSDDVWSYTDAPAPKVNDVLNQVADFLSAIGFKKTLKALEKEAKGDGFEIDNKAWKKTVEAGSAPSLPQLWYEHQAKTVAADDDSSSASSDSDSSSESSSEDDSSDSDSDGEGMILDIKAAVSDESSSSESEAEVKPKAKATNSKRKRSPTPSSSSASSSEDSSSDEAPPAKKRVVVKKASSASSSDSSSSDSSSESSSDSSSESSSDSSSDSDSSSESEAPAPKKKASKKETAEKKPKEDKKPKEKKEKVSSKKSDDSAASSVTIGRIEVPETSAVVSASPAEDPTAGMHPARLAMIDGGKPKVAAVAVVKEKGGKKQNVPFSRISADQYVDPRLASNAYVPYDYAEKAHRDLIVTKGKGFTKEKNKKKRGESWNAILEP